MPVTDEGFDIQSGAGGYILVGLYFFDVSRWELMIDPRLIERTNTTPRTLTVDDDGDVVTSAGIIGTRYRATVLDPSGKLEFPWDNAKTPDSMGLIPGSEINLTLYRGNSLKGYKVFHTCIGAVELVNDASKDVVRGVMSFKGGDVADIAGDEYVPVIMADDAPPDEEEEA